MFRWTAILLVIAVQASAGAAEKALRVGLLVGSGGQCAAFSPDGRCILTAGSNEARLWSAESLRATTDPLRHEDKIFRAKFVGAGSEVLTCSADTTARLWDVRTGKPLHRFKHPAAVVDADVDREGSHIATACDEKVRLWDCAMGTLSGSFTEQGRVSSVSFSPDGKRLLVCVSSHGYATVLAVPTGRPLLSIKAPGFLNCATWSGDGRWIATGGGETARIWNARTGKPQGQTADRPETVYGIAFNHDGSQFVTFGRFARVWDTLTCRQITKQLGSADGQKDAAVFSPDDRRLMLCGNGGDSGIWDICTKTNVLTFGDCPTAVAGAISPDGSLALTACLSSGNTYVYRIR